MYLFLCVFFLNSVIEATFPSLEETRKKQSLINGTTLMSHPFLTQKCSLTADSIDLRIQDQISRQRSEPIPVRSENPFRDIILRNVDRVALGILTGIPFQSLYLPLRGYCTLL
jgi:hypothetical protein